MRSAIFSALVWITSSALIGLRAASLSPCIRLLGMLRVWAIAAFVISIALRLLFRETCVGERPVGRQVRSAFSAFGLFSLLVITTMAASVSGPAPWSGRILTFVGGCVAPVLVIMALEFSELRPRATALGAIIAGGLISFALVNVLVARPAPRPGIIRTKPPANAGERPRQSTRPERA